MPTTFSQFTPISIFPDSAGQNNLVLLSTGGGAQWGVVPIASGGTGKTNAQQAIDALTIGNLNMSGTSVRITGDFSNSTIANRTLFQTKTSAQGTQLGIVPNGSVVTAGVASGINLEDSTSASGNGSFFSVQNIQGGEIRFTSGARGTGAVRPFSYYLGGSVSSTLALDSLNSKHAILNVLGGGVGGGASFAMTVTPSDDHWASMSIYRDATGPSYVGIGSSGTNISTRDAVSCYYQFNTHYFRTPAGSNLLTIGNAGQLMLGAPSNPGSAGQFLMSQGSGAGATWSSQLPQTITATTQPVGTNNTTIATTAYVMSATVNNATYLNGLAASTEVVGNTIAQRTSDGSLKAAIFYGRATSANYADLAEKYTTDQEYPVGTVVVIGDNDDAECTASTTPGQFVHGVISEKPAYLMNADAPGQAIALTGRVPVRVVGGVVKGQRLAASTIPGCASASAIGSFATALETNMLEGEQLVECAIVR